MGIRERIEERLIALDLSVRGASLAAGLGETTLRNYLKSMSQSMKIDTAEKLAPVLKVSAQWLLYGETAEILAIWEGIPDSERPRARGYLEALTKSSEG